MNFLQRSLEATAGLRKMLKTNIRFITRTNVRQDSFCDGLRLLVARRRDDSEDK